MEKEYLIDYEKPELVEYSYHGEFFAAGSGTPITCTTTEEF